MCLITCQRKPIITKEDIIVYKHLKVIDKLQYTMDTSYNSYSSSNTTTASYNTNTLREYKSRYQDFYWVMNGLYKTYITHSFLPSSKVDNVNYFCFFDCESQSYYIQKDKLPLFLSSISNGFHFALNNIRFTYSDPLEIFKFKVPAGSKIFYDETALGVTDQIIFLNQ